MNSFFVFLQNAAGCILNFFAANSTSLVSGFTGIIGAMVGGNIAAKATMGLERWRTLRDAYANFFAAFMPICWKIQTKIRMQWSSLKNMQF